MKKQGEGRELKVFFCNMKDAECEYRTQNFEFKIGIHATQTKNISENFKIQDQQDTGAWD
jgi:hypothetical protein